MVVDLKEIAKRTNVNVSTVSKALNNYSTINTETKEKILKVVKELNYRPNMSALRLRKQKTFTLGVFFPYIRAFDYLDYFYLGEILKSITAVTSEDAKYDILIQIPRDGSISHDYHRLFNEQKVDGIIIVFPETNDPGLKELEHSRMPTVLVNTTFDALDHVITDNRDGTIQAIEHLITLGHSRIALATQPVKYNACLLERLNAYREILAKHSIPCEDDIIIENFLTNADEKAVEHMLQSKPTAVFATSDSVAAKIMNVFNKKGIRVPDDISIVGFDDNPLASSVTPALTTVRQSIYNMGREATHMIINRIEKNPAAQQKKMIPAELVIRSSTKAINK